MSGIHVAIIGGGITGVILALGLEKRRVSYTLYERGPGFTELGAGIGFSPNAERALTVVDPEVYRVYKQVASSNHEEEYFTWVDGYKTNEIVAELFIGVDAFQGGRRSDFVEAWSRLIPPGKVKFRKEIVEMNELGDGKVSLSFQDGSADESDIVIGCDGIRSKVRQLLLGEDNPASYSRYTNKFCFRTLVPMDIARAALGEERILKRYMYNGPNNHAIIYPVAAGELLNLLVVISDPNSWETADGKQTAPGDKSEALYAFADWHPHVRAMVNLLPEKLDKWAIFDMYEHPAPYFSRRSVGIAGDAAHAAGPHLGSGAGFGIEDALVLASLLQAANSRLLGDNDVREEKAEVCRNALIAYNKARFDRATWLPGATRKSSALFQWQDEEVGSDAVKFAPEIKRLFHTIWDNDIVEMVRGAVQEFHQLTLGTQGGNDERGPSAQPM